MREKTVLVGINSQYIHTNLAIRYLKRYVEKNSKLSITLYETNVNNRLENILADIYVSGATQVIFSTYIWNKEYVFNLSRELKKIMPKVKIVLGGPEVSYSAKEILENNPFIDFVLVGEGERVLLNYLTKSLKRVKGVASIENEQFTYFGDEKLIENLDEIPFPYEDEELKEGKKILYYESTRGCPFNCSYCLSSIDKAVRYKTLKSVEKDMDRFIDSNVSLVKFVDRTFNLRKDRYLAIWEYLLKRYRKGIIFHFEINANIFDDEIIEFLKKVPENYFQFEIGVQSINKETMESIDRRNLLETLEKNVKVISKNIHLHVDLIAGLPYDTYETFKSSFNYVYRLRAEMIQLGFLKILSGTKISKEIKDYRYEYMGTPPYEVLSNRFLSYSELIRLKDIEKMLDFYYNSEKFKNTIGYIIDTHYREPFDFFEEISTYYRERGLLEVAHKMVNIFNHLYDFFSFKNFEGKTIFVEYLKLDYLLLGKPGFYPAWFKSNKDKERYSDMIEKEDFNSIREAYKKTEFESFNYDVIEDREGEVDILFNYSTQKTSTKVIYKKNFEKLS